MTGTQVSGRTIQELVSLTGRRAVVTGGAKGLGAAIAGRLADAGAAVLVADLDDDAAAATAASIGGSSVHLDVADSASVAAVADAVVERLGGLDIWVNNAGVYPSRPVLEMTDEEWDAVLDVNLRGTFLGCRESARRMVAAGHGGVIVNLSSVAGLGGRGPRVPHYVASKHGVVGLTKQLALELGVHGIRVLAVAPSQIVTPGVEAAMARSATAAQPPTSPLGRVGEPDDVARVVLFCASDLASFMSGSTLVVDGGETAR